MVVAACGGKPPSPFLKSGGPPTAGTILVFAIRVYRWTISPALVFIFGSNAGCRFTPTCSQYAMAAVQSHGALAGSWLSAKRICRCHPWGGCGHDAVPPGGLKIKDSKLNITEFVR
jgi:putative membrane protein insertion efficiency factor